MVSRKDYGMSEQEQSFHVGDRGSNPRGDANTYRDTPGSLTPISPQNLKQPDPNRLQRGQYRSERRALKEARARCFTATNKDYAAYGGRGIGVCQEWLGPFGFERFLAHIGPKPDPRATLDRIDNARGYEPGNVRWATREQQRANRRDTARRAS